MSMDSVIVTDAEAGWIMFKKKVHKIWIQNHTYHIR